MPAPTFYILHGDDDLGIQEALQKMRDDADDLNTSEFDGTNAAVPEIINAVSSYPFLSDKRLVIVRGMLDWLTRKGAGETGKRGIEKLVAELPNLPESARLVFVERASLSEKHKVLQLAKSTPSGYVKLFSAPKDLTQWLMHRAKSAYECEITPRAAAALSAVLGDDLRRADNELFKLSLYVTDGQPINEADVAALTPYVAEANIFKMVDAIAEGKAETAMQLLHRLLQDKDQDPFSLFGMITRQFRLLLLAKEHLTAGAGANTLANALHVQSFVAQNLARQSRPFTLAQLEQIYKSLLDYDLKMKTGEMKPALALDLLVAALVS